MNAHGQNVNKNSPFMCMRSLPPNFDHAPAWTLNLIYELSPKGKLPKICPLRRTRSHHCVALNLALLAGRKLFHLPLF